MSKGGGGLQESFLERCRSEGVRCVIYLVNGVQLRGIVRAFDNFTLLLETDNVQQIVYKHAITTVQPLRRLAERGEAGERADRPQPAESPEGRRAPAEADPPAPAPSATTPSSHRELQRPESSS